MGAYQNNPQPGGKGGKGRGSTKNASRLADFGGSEAPGESDWGDCHSEKLQAVVAGVTALGGAVTFGLSRDKGAYMLTLLLDDSRKTMWYNGDADIDSELDLVAARLEALA